jgi:hypothetical protein
MACISDYRTKNMKLKLLQKFRMPVEGFLHCHNLAKSPHHCQSLPSTMPKIRTTRTKKPPEGFEDIESVSALVFHVFENLSDRQL